MPFDLDAIGVVVRDHTADYEGHVLSDLGCGVTIFAAYDAGVHLPRISRGGRDLAQNKSREKHQFQFKSVPCSLWSGSSTSAGHGKNETMANVNYGKCQLWQMSTMARSTVQVSSTFPSLCQVTPVILHGVVSPDRRRGQLMQKSLYPRSHRLQSLTLKP